MRTRVARSRRADKEAGVWWWVAIAAAGPLVDGPTAEALVARGATVLDTRGIAAFLAGHIPGAQPVDWRVGVDGWTSGRVVDPQALAAALAARGVDGDRPVLVVGSWLDGWGEEARILWDLAYLGHPDAHVLRGGDAAWLGPRARGPAAQATPGRFVARPQEALRLTLDEVRAGGVRLIDVREADEYAGATHFLEARGGHIPGASHLPWRTFLNVAPGFPADQPVGVYCTGGVRSAFAWMLLTDAGVPAANYDGSWWEYAREVPAR